jgi:hypothetical protein
MAGSCAVWIARRLPVDDAAHREEVAGSVAELVAERPRRERAGEAISLIGLWLQLWGRREGLDDVRQAVRQGIYLGGVVLAFAAAATAWGARGSGSAAVLASVAAALAAGGWRVGAVGAAAGAAIVTPLAVGTLPALPVLAALAFVVGARFGARHCWRGLAAGALIAVALALVGASLDEVWAGGPVPALGAVAGTLLLVGRFDARFALAATTAGLGALAMVGAVVPSPAFTALVLLVVLSGQLSYSALRRSYAV